METKNFFKAMQTRIFFEISRPIIILGFFLVTVFIALGYQTLSGVKFILIIFLIAIFIFLFSFIISQQFAQPVEKLKNAAKKIKEGELGTRIYLESKDEFTDLAMILNQLAEELEKSRFITEQAKTIVGIKARVRTKEFEEMIKDLEEKIKEKTTELQKQIAEFKNVQQLSLEHKQKMAEFKEEIKKLKEEFIVLTAHQLRTPLSGIKWNLKMMIDGSFGKLTDEQKKFLFSTYQNNERMIKLVNDLLDTTKIEEGRYFYDIQKEDIIDITNKVTESLKEKIQEKNLEFKFIKPEEEIPEIEVDREKIIICVQNLLVNAINYTNPQGKVTLSIKYDKNKKEIILSVSDTGIGIPKEQQKKVFNKFYRASNAIKAEAVGSGLGLYIIKTIIETHKGKIWFESEENKGSTFYFSLPAAE